MKRSKLLAGSYPILCSISTLTAWPDFVSLFDLHHVVFQIVLDKSEQSLEYNWMPEISTTRAVAEDTSLLHSTAPGPVLHTAHRQHTEGIFLDELP